jgi:hypothetical protein
VLRVVSLHNIHCGKFIATFTSLVLGQAVTYPGTPLEFTFVLQNATTPATVQEAGLWVQNGDRPSTLTAIAFRKAKGA